MSWFSYNVLRVAAVGDFGALHCHPAQKFDSSTQLQFCTSPPIEATRCYHQCFLVCRGLSVYLLLLLFSLSFVVRRGIFKISFCLGLALQALLKTLVVFWLMRFLIVLANCVGYFLIVFNVSFISFIVSVSVLLLYPKKLVGLSFIIDGKE